MRERVAWHLRDLATEVPADSRCIASVTQQQLADHVGTAREGVARVLRELREAGIVLTTKRQLEITDPARLAAIAGRKSSPVFQGKAPAAVDQNRQLRPEAPARLP